jgi:energy-coupling factor transport system ATP-binding protein
MPEISIEGLVFAYPGGAQVFPSPGIDLSLQGGAIALVGENGAGKTTLSKLLNGLLRPRAGALTVAGVPVKARTVAQMAPVIGYAFQNPDDQLFQRTVRDEVAFGPRAMHRPADRVARAVDEALARCGLTDAAATHPHDLGLPERKWVTIASALAAEPPVLVLDEPTLGQDALARERLSSLVRSLAADGLLVLVITHDMDFVAETCATTVILTRGEVRYQGPTAGAFEDERLLKDAGLEQPHATRLASALGAHPAPVGEAAVLEWLKTRSASA